MKQPQYPWSDGPEYVTQCPIKPGNKFSQKVIFSEEEGTLWWHAHSDWSRATAHGAIVARLVNFVMSIFQLISKSIVIETDCEMIFGHHFHC